MENKTVNNMRDLRECWCDWVSGRQKGNFYKMLGNSGDGGKTGRVSRDSINSSRAVLTCFNCGEAGHRAVDCKVRGAGSPNVDRVTSPATRGRQPTCFTCHKEAHKSPDCPSRKIGSAVKEPGAGRMTPMSRATLGSKGKKNVVMGKVNGVEMKVLVDIGVDLGLIPKTLAPGNAVDCGEKYISGVHGDMVLHQCTKATFEVAGLSLEREVVIDDSDDSSSSCILPLDLGEEEEVMAFMRAVKHGEVNVLTRSQARAEAELDRVEGDSVVTELGSVGRSVLMMWEWLVVMIMLVVVLLQVAVVRGRGLNPYGV